MPAVRWFVRFCLYPPIMGLSAMQELSQLSDAAAARWIATQDPWVIEEMARGEWWFTARPEQRMPPGAWFIWLLMSGRGFGKTKVGAETLVSRALQYPLDVTGFRTEWLLIAETLSDALRQCVAGPAGIKRVLERRVGPEKRGPHDGTGRWRLWKAPKPWIELPDEQAIWIEGADDEDVGRGYNAAGAWLDEFAKWPKPDGSWMEGILPSLRADLPGDHPRVVVTTTPKLVAQLMRWEDADDGSVYVTRGSTYDNAMNLAAPVLAELHKAYHGTRIGRQELYGELIREIAGALWSYEWIEKPRVHRTPLLTNRVVAMDAAGGDEPTSDLCGLVAAGRGVDGRDYVLGDWSKRIVGNSAARRAWEMVIAYDASVLIYEDNQGKRWLRQVLVDAYLEMQKEGLFPPGGAPPLKSVTAKVGKRLRAEPVAARYEQKRVSHVGVWGDLETQMVSWVPEQTPKSPDRVDALVYAILFLADREALSVQAANPAAHQVPRTPISPLAGRTGGGFNPYGRS